jgi:hypothetical protein
MSPLVAAGYVTENELDRLLQSRPTYLIFWGDRTPPPPLIPQMQDLLQREYKIWLKVKNLHVYRRTD